MADRATSDNPRTSLTPDLAVTDPIGWARESEREAHEITYDGGQLKGAAKADLDEDSSTPVPELPDGYTDTARELARKRVALAGYRMADRLNSILDP